METIVEQMINETRDNLKNSGDYDNFGEEGIRIAVYEDLRDTLKQLFSDVAYEWVAVSSSTHDNKRLTTTHTYERNTIESSSSIVDQVLDWRHCRGTSQRRQRITRDQVTHLTTNNWVATDQWRPHGAQTKKIKPRDNDNMTRIKALQHLIWREQELKLFRPRAFNQARLNRLMRELRELGGKTYEEE